ncbi:MAG: toprim domain-containing protein, partial [Patescibacteria group bacterium]
ENTVAISGTALTPFHLALLKRLTNNIIVAFDKDSAGIEATKRGIDLALKSAFDIKVLTVSSGKDPADLIKENPDQWKKSLAQSAHLIEFYLNTLVGFHSDPVILKKEVSAKVLPYISLIQNEMEKAHWVSETAKKLKIREEPIWEELKKAKSPLSSTQEKYAPFLSPFKTRRRLLEERIIGLSFWKKNAEFLPTETEALLGEESKSLWQRLKKDLNAGFLTEEEKKLCQRLEFEAELYYDGLDLDKEIKLIASELKKEKLKKELEELALRIQELESTDENKNNKEAIEKHLKEFQTISKELF